MAKYYGNQRRRVKVVKKGGFGGKVVAFLLGVFMGAAGIVGGLVGAGYYVANKPVENTVNKIDEYANTNLYETLFGNKDEDGNQVGGLLNEKYAKMTVEELLSDVTEAVNALSGDGTLADVNEISPKVDELIDMLLEKTAEYSVPIDKETLMTTKLNELADYLLQQAKSTPLGELLAQAGIPKDALYYALCYGEEGVDYIMDGDKVEMLPGKEARTVQSILTLGVNGIVDSLTLEAAGGDKLDLTDPTISAIVYGPKNRYEINPVTKKVTMKQIVYTFEDKGEEGGTKLYDDQGKAVDGTLNGDALTLADGSVQYLQEVTSADDTVAVRALSTGKVVYLAFTDEQKQEPALYKKTNISVLMKDPLAMIDGVTLDTFIPVNKNTHPVILALLFGSDGYYLDEKDNPVPTAPCKTISDLRTNSSNLINGIFLKDVLPVTASSPDVMLYLAYGEKNIDYTIDPDTQEIICANPRTFGDLMNNSDAIINDLPLKEALGVNSKSHPVVIALAYGTKGTDYTIQDKGVDEEGDGDTLTVVPAKDATPRKLSDLMGSGSTALFNQLQLADVLGLKQGAHSVLLSLVFGADGYEFDGNGNAVAKAGSTPTTLEQLSGSGSQALIEGIYLSDALNVNEESHPVLRSLAIKADGTKTKLSDLTGSGATALIEGIRLSDALDINEQSHPILRTLAVKADGTHATLADLMGEGSATLINEIALTDLITPTSTENDLFVMFLLYGKSGVRYELDENKQVVMKQQWVSKEGNNVYNEYGDLLEGHTLVDGVYTTKEKVVYTATEGEVTMPNGTQKKVYFLSDKDGKVLFPFTKLGDITGKNSAFSNLTEHITLKEILGDTSGNKILGTLGNETIASLPEAINNLTVQTVYHDEIFDKQGEIQGRWKYLLVENNEVKDYKITELNKLISNMQNNITSAEIKDLHTDGMISLKDATILEKKLLTEISTTVKVGGTEVTIRQEVGGIPEKKSTYGDLTVQEMLDYMTALFTAVDAFEAKMPNYSKPAEA